MKNTIHISVEFSFKGETFKPATVIDLDLLNLDIEELPDLHNLLAQQGSIDTYSYAFEVMQQSPILFSNATGLACECMDNGCFSLLVFTQKRKETELHQSLQKLASDTLDIADLETRPELKEALIQAYRLGQNNS